MKFTIAEIAQLVGGQTEGDSSTEITGLAKIEDGSPGKITFLANPKYESHIYQTKASAVIVAVDFQAKSPVSATLIRCANPYLAFTGLLKKAAEMIQDKRGIEKHAFISETATVGENVYIGAFAYIGDGAQIGDGARIYPHSYIGDHAKIGTNSIVYSNVSIYYGCQIGEDCILHSGCVIGSDGFGFAPSEGGVLQKIPQTGIVRLENKVEIGAGTTIDRATLGETVIRTGVKLDNLIQVAHNVEIGAHTVVAAQTGISGSTKLGQGCMIGGQVGIVGHLNLANGTKVGAQSGISKSSKEEGKAFRGSPAQDYKKQLRSEAVFKNLDALAKKVHELEKKLADMA